MEHKLQAALARRDWAEAERLLRRAAQRADASAAVFYNLARVLELGGKTAQRLAWLRRATAAEPGHADAWFETGRALVEADDLAGAERAFARAAVLQPGAEDAWRMLGRIRLRLGRWAEARAAFAHAGPPDAEARLAAYRIACELGEPADALRRALLEDGALRPAALRALVQTARGRLPLRLPPPGQGRT